MSHLLEPRSVSAGRRKHFLPAHNTYNGQHPHVFDYLRGVGRDLGVIFPPDCLQLRLVSKAFNRSVRRAWFAQMPLLFRAHEQKELSNGNIRTLKRNSNVRIYEHVYNDDTFAPLVRHARVELFSWINTNIDGVGQWMDPSNGQPNRSYEETQAIRSCFLDLLPDALWEMQQLESLSIYMPTVWTSPTHTNTPVVAFDLDAFGDLRVSLSAIFSHPSNEFEHLTDLHLDLPCTYHLAAVGKVLSDEACLRLRHLYLEYCDATGHGGSRMYERDPDGAPDTMEYRNIRPSNLQQLYPNTQYMGDVCTLIGRCKNLISLGLRATHFLDLETLDWRPTGNGLQNLYIYRAIVGSETLKRLLSGSDGSTCHTVAVHLDNVHLLDSTWSRIFGHPMTTAPLKYFGVSNINYAYRGSSSHLKELNNRPWENSAIMWSRHADVRVALKHIVKKTVKAGGMLGWMLASDHEDWDHEGWWEEKYDVQGSVY